MWSFDDLLPQTTSVDPKSWFNVFFYQQSYFWNLIFWNSHPSRSLQWILVTDFHYDTNLQIFIMTPILHHVKSYLETAILLRITYSFFGFGWVFYRKKSFAFPTPLCFPGVIPAMKWQCITWIPLARSSQPQLLWLWFWQQTAPFSGAGLMTGLSVFLNKESPVTQIFLFLMVCVFSPFPSALPSVCRSFSLLFLSCHTAFCTLASFSLRLLSLYSFLCFELGLVFGGRYWFIYLLV